jgi:hypothetical protein
LNHVTKQSHFDMQFFKNQLEDNFENAVRYIQNG